MVAGVAESVAVVVAAAAQAVGVALVVVPQLPRKSTSACAKPGPGGGSRCTPLVESGAVFNGIDLSVACVQTRYS